MGQFRYWRQEADWRSCHPKGQPINQANIGSVAFWSAVILVALLLTFILLRQNVNSMYNLPGGPWSESVYWQEYVNGLCLKAVASSSWQRAALFVFSGERLGNPMPGEFPQLAPFEGTGFGNSAALFRNSNPWLDNFFLAPCALLMGRRFANILLICGSLLSNAVAMAFLLKVLGKSNLSAALGAWLFILNPLNLLALSALDWSVAYLAWAVLGLAFIVKIYRGEEVSLLALGIIVLLASAFCGWIAFFLLLGIGVAAKLSKVHAYLISMGSFLGLALAIYVASASLNSDFRWLSGTYFVQISALGTMALLAIVRFLINDVIPKREWLWCVSCLILILLLSLLGKYGILVGGIILALWWSWGLSSLPERCHFRYKHGVSIVAFVFIMLSIFGAEKSNLSPLPGFNSHIAPSYFLLSHVTQGRASLLELPFANQPLYLFAQTEHGLKLAVEKQLRPQNDDISSKLLYEMLTKLGRGSVQQSREYKQLLENKALRSEAWRQLRKQGVSHLVLHERGCNWAELQRGNVSGATYAQDYLALRALCGAPILEDYEPVSRGRWGWPLQDTRPIAWYRIAIFRIPQEEIDSRKSARIS